MAGPTLPEPGEAPAGAPADAQLAYELPGAVEDATTLEAEPAAPFRPSGRAIALFLAITFGLTWAAGIPLDLWIRTSGPKEVAASLGCLGLAAFFLMMWAPSIGAYITREVMEGGAFADAGLRRGPWRYWSIAWFGPPVLQLVAVGLSLLIYPLDPTFSALSDALQNSGQPLTEPVQSWIMGRVVLALTIGTLMHCTATFGEEFGWRGYLLPRLMQSWGVWPGLLAHGAIWGLWHAPDIVLIRADYAHHRALAVPLFIGLCVLLGVLLGWLRMASGSVLVTTIAHSAFNNSLVFAVLLPPGIDETLAGPLSSLVGWLVLIAAIGVLQVTGALSRAIHAWQEQPVWLPRQAPLGWATASEPRSAAELEAEVTADEPGQAAEPESTPGGLRGIVDRLTG